MAALADSAKELIESGALAHLVAVNADGSPQLSIVWVGVYGDDLVSAHLDARMRKLVNIRRNPRVVLSFEAATSNPVGIRDSLVVHARAVITEAAHRSFCSGWRRPMWVLGPDSRRCPTRRRAS